MSDNKKGSKHVTKDCFRDDFRRTFAEALALQDGAEAPFPDCLAGRAGRAGPPHFPGGTSWQTHANKNFSQTEKKRLDHFSIQALFLSS
jgi:hypothetical protein